MEQSPFSGYLKAAMFGILAFVVFISFWQRTKLEDKIVALDRSVAGIDDRLGEMSSELEANARESAKLRGANETLVDLLARGGVTVGPGQAKPSTPVSRAPRRDSGTGWGWDLNAKLDADLDPSRPVGTPGRYRNFLRLDPDGSPVPKNPPNTNGTLYRSWGPEPKGFNFLIENEATLANECELYVNDAAASRHWKEPSSFNWKPALCWRVEVSPDFREYTLFLRRDAYWQRPNCDLRKYRHLAGRHKVTARDFEFTMKIVQDPQSDCANSRSYYEQLEDVRALDDYTVVYRWKKTVFTSLAWSMAGPLMPRFVYAYDEDGREYPAETVAQEFNDHWFDRLRVGPVGCGPYRFVKYEPNKYVRMERWDDWYGFKDEPLYPVKVRHLRIHNDPENAFTWLRSGELDIVNLNGARYRTWVLDETDPQSPFKDGRIKVYMPKRPVYYYIGWKNTDPMFRDKRVRKAMTYAFDRFRICEKIFLGRWKPMGAPLFPGSREADDSLKPYPFDLEKAKRLLDEAGWALNPDTGLRERMVDGRLLRLEFKLYYPGPNAEYQAALDHFKNDLLKVGVRMTPQSVLWAQFQKDLEERKYRAFTLGWATSGYEHDFVQIWHSRMIQDPKSSNFIEFSNPEVDRLADELRTIMDPEKRVAAVRRIGRILYDEQPYTFFAWRGEFRAYWTHVHNVEETRYYIRPFFRSFPYWITR